MSWKIDTEEPDGWSIFLIDSFEVGLIYGWLLVIAGLLANVFECSTYSRLIGGAAGTAIYIVYRRYKNQKAKETK